MPLLKPYVVAATSARKVAATTVGQAGPASQDPTKTGDDAWVVGDEAVVLVDWYGASNYVRS
jgi:hypothetical protein